MTRLLRSKRPAWLSSSTDHTALRANSFVTGRPVMPSRPASEETRPRAAAPHDPDVLYPSLYAEPVSPGCRSDAYLTALALDLKARLRARDARPAVNVPAKR